MENKDSNSNKERRGKERGNYYSQESSRHANYPLLAREGGDKKETVLIEVSYRNGYNLNLLTRIYERASLVPAVAVTPVLKIYVVIAAAHRNSI